MMKTRKTKSLLKRVNRKPKEVKEKGLKKHLLLLVILFSLLIVIIAGVFAVTWSPESGQTVITPSISNEVLSYQDVITKEMISNGVPIQYEVWILAQMHQESKGRGTDPMQASENKYGKIGAIENPHESIAWGVAVWREHLTLVKELGLIESPELLLQSYNYGRGYLYWLNKSGYEGFTAENALEYSTKMSEGLDENLYRGVNANKDARYGDYLYVEHVKQFIK